MTKEPVPDFTNLARRRMLENDVALGMIVHLGRSGEIARIAKATGHDFLFVDMQHAIFSLETVSHIIQGCIGCGIAPMVRLTSIDDQNASTLLDCGASGLIYPNVNTADEAKRAVARCKFAPIGSRSVQGTYSQVNYAEVPLQTVTTSLNENTLVVCMIETAEGLENVEEIAAVDGVDVLHVGSNDLLFALGNPRAYDGPEIEAAMQRVLAAGRKHGKFIGFGGDKDPARQAKRVAEGVRFITTHGDTHMLLAEFSKRTAELRRLFGEDRPTHAG